jgi:tetratricopeptide (TPR) repeat protein
LPKSSSLLAQFRQTFQVQGGAGEQHTAEEVVRLYEAEAEAGEGPRRVQQCLGEAARRAEYQAHDHEGAHQLYLRAATEPNCSAAVVVGRRRTALRLGLWSDLPQFIDDELDLKLSADERAYLLLLQAELVFARTGAAVRAADLCGQVGRLLARDVRPTMLRAEIASCEWDEVEFATQVGLLAQRVADNDLRAALSVMAGRAHELVMDDGEALKQYEVAAELTPESTSALMGLARTRVVEGDPLGAAQALAKAADCFGSGLASATLRRRSAALMVLAGESAGAVGQLPDAKGYLEWRVRLAAAEAEEDQPATTEALRQLAGLLENPVWRASWLAERVLVAESSRGFELDLMAQQGGDSLVGVVARTEVARRDDDLQQLVEMCKEGEEPSVSLFRRALVYDSQGEFESARPLFEEAATLAQTRTEAELILAANAMASQDWAGYVDLLHRMADAVDQTEWWPDAMVQLGRAHEVWAHDRVAARAGYARALERVPGFLPALQGMRRTAPEGISRVEAARRLAEETEPGSYALSLLVEAGRVAEQTGDTAAAFDMYYAALTNDSQCLPALLGAERLLRQAGRLDELMSLWREVCSTMEGAQASLLRCSMAWHLACRRNDAAAAEELALALAQQPFDATLAHALVRLTYDPRHAERVEEAAERLPLQERVVALLMAADLWQAQVPERALRCLLKVLDLQPGLPHGQLALERQLRHLGRGQEQVGLLEEQLRSTQEPLQQITLVRQLIEAVGDDREQETYWRGQLFTIDPTDAVNLLGLAQRLLADQNREALTDVYCALARELDDADDALAFACQAFRFQGLSAGQAFIGLDAALRAVERHPTDLRALLNMYFAAQKAGDLQRLHQAATGLAGVSSQARVRAAFELRAADALENLGYVAEARESLERAVAEESPPNPVAVWRLSRLAEQQGDLRAAAHAAEMSAAAALVPQHKTQELLRAATLWLSVEEDETDRVLANLHAALAVDPNCQAVHDVANEMLRRQAAAGAGDTKMALDMICLHLSGQRDPGEVARLSLRGARLALELGDRTQARDLLRQALAAQPTSLEALRKLGEVCWEDEEWVEAAHCFVQLARLSEQPEESRHYYFQLGVIYHEHLPDMHRAIQSFNKVLSYDPQHLETLRRLSLLLEEAREWKVACEITERLSRVEPEFESRRECMLRLARAYEVGVSDPRSAEQALEEARRLDPTDLKVVAALAEFYRRQGAEQALTVHLDRAAAEFFRVLETAPCDMAAYRALFHIYTLRGTTASARCAATVLSTFGQANETEAALVRRTGGAAWPVGPSLAPLTLDDALCPPPLSPSLRRLLALVGDSLCRLAPQDLKHHGLSRSRRLMPGQRVYDIAQVVASWYRLGEVDVYLHPEDPMAWALLASAPPAVVLGAGLLDGASDGELRFIVARGLGLHSRGMTLLTQWPEARLELALAALAKLAYSNYVAHHVDERELAPLVKELARLIPRRQRQEMGPLVLESLVQEEVSRRQLNWHATQFGDRMGLLAAGALEPALLALGRLTGRRPPPPGAAARVACVEDDGRIGSLLRFFVSPAHANLPVGLGPVTTSA